jgi:hypothetical protein
MRGWTGLLCAALLIGGCDDGDDGGDPVVDAEVQVDMRTLADLGPQEAAVDAGAADMAPTVDMGMLPDGEMPDAAPRFACSDGLDNDGDGVADFPNDPGCEAADDDDETDPPPTPECADGLDNDEDERVDLADPDCTSALDVAERGNNPTTTCNNGEDDDEDGLTDFPDDPGCQAAGHISEADPVPPPACANAMDDDGDGLTDFPVDPGCSGAGDNDETTPDPAPQCGNGIDDDRNGRTDYPDDIGCDSAGDYTEIGPCGANLPVIDLNAHLAENDAFEATLVDVPNQLVATCGGAAGGEYVFVYTVDRELDRLTFSTVNEGTEGPVVMYLRDRCDGDDVQCTRGLPESPGQAIVLERPALGRYLVVVDTGSREIVGRFRLTVDAVAPPACRDGIDNDEDGLLDLADPGCEETEDDDEIDPPEPPVCANGLDDDGDGAIDYPDDEDCAAAGGIAEEPPCALPIPFVRMGQAGGEVELAPVQGIGAAQAACDMAFGAETVIVLTLTEPSDVQMVVVDANGVPVQAALYARTDCGDPQTDVGCRPGQRANEPFTMSYLDRGTYFLFAEQGPLVPPAALTARVTVNSRLTQCNDELDNDDDGRIDLADPGCAEALDENEQDPPEPPQCADGIDNDENGLIDWPEDDGCEAAGDDDEAIRCTGQFFGEVCLEHVSEPCVRGSAREYCTVQGEGFEVITLAEFQAIVAAGWVRPNGNYHTVAVTEYAECPGGFGNVGIPGWGQFNRFNCDENANYCQRAVFCVSRR